MRSVRKRRGATFFGKGVAALAVAGLLAASLAQAQEGGLVGVFDIGAGGQLANGTSTRSQNALTPSIGFGLTSTTRSQRLGFRLDTTARTDKRNGTEIRPVGSLSYLLTNRSSELSFGATYRIEEAAGSALLEDFFAGELISDNGVRQSSTANFRFITGKDRPFGTDTRIDYGQRRYTGTADPNLVDTQRLSASETLRFNLTRTASLLLTGSYLQRETGDLLNRNEISKRLSAGLDVQADAAWRLSGTVGFAKIDTEMDTGFGGRTTVGETGAELNLQATRAVQNGTYSFGFAHDLSVAGGRTSLRAGRALAQRTATFDGSLGLVRFDSGTIAPIATLAYTRALPRDASFQISLDQSVATTLEDRNSLRTLLAASYSRPINRVSNWSVNTSLARIDVVGTTDGDATRADFGVNYNRSLTADWQLAVGLQAQRGFQANSSVSRSNILSANVRRSFSFRP